MKEFDPTLPKASPSPWARLPNETEKQFYERVRSGKSDKTRIRMLWNSTIQGTYVVKKHGFIG